MSKGFSRAMDDHSLNVVKLTGEGFKIYIDPYDPDPDNPLIKDRELHVVKSTLSTKLNALILPKLSYRATYKGVAYVVNRRKDYILINKEENVK